MTADLRRSHPVAGVGPVSAAATALLPAEAVAAAARRWVGTPWLHQGSLRGAGCDCIGLLRGLWRELVGAEPLAVPPYTTDWCETGRQEVLTEALGRVLPPWPEPCPGPGAVVVFRMRRGAVAKHCGVMVAPGRFVHARERLGVIEEAFGPAWARRGIARFGFPLGGAR